MSYPWYHGFQPHKRNPNNRMQALPKQTPKTPDELINLAYEDADGRGGGRRLPRDREKTSAHASFHASLTVEAALLFPIFLLVLYLFWTFFPVMQTEIRLQYAMDSVTERLAKQSYVLELVTEKAGDLGISGLLGEEETDESLLLGLSDLAWKTYAKTKVVEEAGRTALEQSPVENGSSGLSFAGSTWDRKGDICLSVTYKVSFPAVFGLKLNFPVTQKSLRKCWTGLNGTGEGEAGEDTQEEIVYITETGTVYHRSLDCYHLKLTITSCSLSEVGSKRNNEGAKYYPCERCASSADGTSVVYITTEGNRYHTSSDCAGLKRTISSVPLSEVEGMRACQNCG